MNLKIKFGKKFPWDRISRPMDYVAVAIATALGPGLIRLGPGTFGSIAALPLVYFSSQWELPARLGLWLGLTVLGTWACKVIAEITGDGDNQAIVIDEVVGVGITAWTAGQNLQTLAIAFVFFRFFDITKPPPVRQIDHWSKNRASQGDRWATWLGGWGVMADDILAAFQGLICILLLQHWGLLD